MSRNQQNYAYGNRQGSIYIRGNKNNPQEGDIRFTKKNDELLPQRFEQGDWQDHSILTGSIHTDKYFLHKKGTAGLYVEEGSHDSAQLVTKLISTGIDSGITMLSDHRSALVIMSNRIVVSETADETEIVINDQKDKVVNVKSYSFIITLDKTIMVKNFKVDVPQECYFHFDVCETATGRCAFESSSLWKFQQSPEQVGWFYDGTTQADVYSGELPQEIHMRRGIEYVITITSDRLIDVSHSNADRPYVFLKGLEMENYEIVKALKYYSYSTYNIGDTIVNPENKTVILTCNTDATTGDFDAQYWDAPAGGGGYTDRIISDDTLNVLNVNDTKLSYGDDGRELLGIGGSVSSIYSFDRDWAVMLHGTRAGIKDADNGVERIFANDTETWLYSPDGVSQRLHVDNLGAYVNSNEILTEADKNVVDGLTTLGADLRLLPSQMPGIVPTLQEGYKSLNQFYEEVGLQTLITPDIDKIYVDLTGGSNQIYRWSGTLYIELSSSLVLGVSAANAFPGPEGQTAYQHAVSPHNYAQAIHPHNVIKSNDTLNSLNTDDDGLYYSVDALTRLSITDVFSKFVSPDGLQRIRIDNTGAYYNDVLIVASADKLTSPDTLQTVTTDDEGTKIEDDGTDRLIIAGSFSSMSSPDALTSIQVDNDGAVILDNGVIRYDQNATYSTIKSPNGSQTLSLDNNGAYHNGKALRTSDDENELKSADGITKLTLLNDSVALKGSNGITRLYISDLHSMMLGFNGTHHIKVTNDGAYYDGAEIAKKTDIDNMAGTVVSSVSWNANTTASGEAALSYRKNHLKAFRLAPGIWSIENMGTNPLMPGDSADWITNSIGGGIGDPFFLVELNIIALGQPGVGQPVTVQLSATALTASPNTGNLGSMIVKIKDKDGVTADPTLAAAYATVKLTYIK
jgi:hypothetical protein